MDKLNFYSALQKAFELNKLEISLTDQMFEHLFCLYELLVSENKKYNLTAITDAEQVIYKHFVDSMLLSAHIPQNSTLIDIGCGAGFPSLPLGIARPDLKITSLDSTNKKIQFINLVCNAQGLQNINAICARAEELAHNAQFRDKFDISTARAVANFPILCELCLPFVRGGGKFLSMKGRNSESELSISPSSAGQLSASMPVISTYSLIMPDNTEQRTLVSINKLGKTLDNFPRKYAQIIKKPLK